MGWFGPSFLSNKQGDLPFFLYFSERPLVGNIERKKFWKLSDNFFFFWGITLICQILTAVDVDSSQSDYPVWLLSILSRHSLIIIKFIRTIMHHHKKIMNIVMFSLGGQKQCTSSPQIWYKKSNLSFFFLNGSSKDVSKRFKGVICFMAKQE